MPTLSNETHRRALVERVRRVTPDATPQWGRMDPETMLCHVADALDAGLGRLHVPPGGPAMLRHFPMKQLAIYVIPMPRGAKAPQELFATARGDFEQSRQRVIAAMEESAGKPAGMGPAHFLFGPLSYEQWNVLHWKHIDHHLRQFGA